MWAAAAVALSRRHEVSKSRGRVFDGARESSFDSARILLLHTRRLQMRRNDESSMIGCVSIQFGVRCSVFGVFISSTMFRHVSVQVGSVRFGSSRTLVPNVYALPRSLEENWSRKPIRGSLSSGPLGILLAYSTGIIASLFEQRHRQNHATVRNRRSLLLVPPKQGALRANNRRPEKESRHHFHSSGGTALPPCDGSERSSYI